MFSATLHLLPIKDLKALSVFLSAGFYRHAGPKGPEEVFFTGALAGDRPPRYEEKRAAYRRARACPSPCPGARVRLRGTGPRATGTSRPGGLSYREGIDI